MKNYNIHLLRHGQTQANAEGRFVGSTDVELSPAGREELLQLQREYEYPTVACVYASPLKRCTQTAELLYPERLVVPVPELREYEFGPYEEKCAAEMTDDLSFMAWLRGGLPPEGMEPLPEFEQRIRKGFETVLMDMMRRKITSAALVVHGGVIMTLLAALGLPKREPKLWMVGNGHGYTVATSSLLWSQGQLVEVFDRLPYEALDNDPLKEYNFIDLVEDAKEAQRQE